MKEFAEKTLADFALAARTTFLAFAKFLGAPLGVGGLFLVFFLGWLFVDLIAGVILTLSYATLSIFVILLDNK